MSEDTNNIAPQSARSVLKQLQRDFEVIRNYLPLAIGIDKQVMERQPEINKKLLRNALGFHTKSVPYLKALQIATSRFNLDGSTAGEVDEEQRNRASQSLRDYFKAQAEARKAKEADEAAKQAERERQEKLQQLADKFSRK